MHVLIIGAGHYSTGSTVLSGKTKTDKDFGVLLPSVLELRKQGLVGNVLLCGRDGRKISLVRQKIRRMAKQFDWDPTVEYFPVRRSVDPRAYREALKHLPKPGVVLIATPDGTHKEIILDCIKAGFHFVVVKPIVVRLKDLRDITRALRHAGVLGLVDYHKAYDEANLILKDEYESGKYGDLQHALSIMT